jgi:hypothetical protein
MGYSSFSLNAVKEKFNLNERRQLLFPTIEPIEPSDLLVKTLARAQRAVPMNNEKSRAEFIVAPILLEVTEQHLDVISFFSGENLDADKKQGLVGECDYIFSLVPESSTVDFPIICLVECENDNINTGMGQVVAQMVGARLLNEKKRNDTSAIYGCVTTGREWRFLKLIDNTFVVHPQDYFLKEINEILGFFHLIIKHKL